MAEQIGFSASYLDNVMSARKPYTGKLMKTIRALIPAKANDPEPGEQGDVDLPAEPGVRGGSLEDFGSLLDQHVRKSTDIEARLAREPVTPDYSVIDQEDGTAHLVEFVGRFKDPVRARKICLKLNQFMQEKG